MSAHTKSIGGVPPHFTTPKGHTFRETTEQLAPVLADASSAAAPSASLTSACAQSESIRTIWS